MTYDASNRKSVREAEKLAKIVEENSASVIRGLMSTTSGRQWAWERLAEANVFSSTYNDSPQRMAYLEGQRSSGLTLLGDITRWCPEEFILAMREANGRRTEQSVRDTNRAARERPGSEEPGRVDQGHPDDAAGDYDPHRASED